MHQLALRLIAKAKASNDPLDEPLRAFDWWYPEDQLGDPQMEAVLAEINGWNTDPGVKIAELTREQAMEVSCSVIDRDGNASSRVASERFRRIESRRFHRMRLLGFTRVCFGRDGVNRANSRKSRDYLGHGWGFAWPSDRRIIYNRASAQAGRPSLERTEKIGLVGLGKMDRHRCCGICKEKRRTMNRR